MRARSVQTYYSVSIILSPPCLERFVAVQKQASTMSGHAPRRTGKGSGRNSSAFVNLGKKPARGRLAEQRVRPTIRLHQLPSLIVNAKTRLLPMPGFIFR